MTFGRAHRQRIAISREDEVSDVFERIDRNRYRSIRAKPAVLPDNCPQFPEVTVLSQKDMQFNCDQIDFVYSDDFPDPPSNSASFNNIFVQLSKAVNLQANYLGYDLTRMDPLHLVDTGTSRPVFQMPTGASKDYFDFNRVFVPDGLFYLSEFNGGSITKTTLSSSTSDYRNHFSQTVGVSAGVGEADKQEGPKDGAKFGFSDTINRARSIIHAENHELSIGTSQVALYALVLNKAHMQLNKEFRDRLSYLQAFPTDGISMRSSPATARTIPMRSSTAA